MFLNEPFGGLIPGARGAVLSVLLKTGAPLTGRQVHRLVGDYSLWSVQEALKVLTRLGLVENTAAGQATLYTVNSNHYAIESLSTVADPITALRTIISKTVDKSVKSVTLFGSIARGEGTESSDIDLAVVTVTDWDGRTDLQMAVSNKLGTPCDVITFTESEFADLAEAGEPVVTDIIRDGVALLGTKPRIRKRSEK